LAIKVMKADCRDHPQVERRFLREARVTGSLQHPGIVAVHNLGRLVDGRLHYTMRLVRGRTFADILKEEAGKPERLPSLLAIFEKVCEAVAYAHSKHVIHRDLKPANVMVGKFGEVQVMDWGLAKLLTPEGKLADEEPRPETGGTLIHTEAADTPSDLTRAGTGIGTPAYMPPEQAQGDWELVDERADVFALGAMLCVILTGQPPYSGKDGNDLLRRARRGDLADALARLEKCGADAVLTELCRECLSVERQQRPRDAGMVALRVADYQAEVEARLRQAELERTEAEVKSREERKRRRLTLSLSAAVLLVFIAGTLFSTLFAIDAHRQADAARKHAEKAENEKVRADKNARQAEAEKQLALRARDDEELALIEGLLLPIGRAIGPLSETEVDAFTLLNGLRSDHTRLRFIEEGLRMPERAQRLALRAEWVIQAAIGLDEALRQKVKEVLMRRLRQVEAPREVQTACVMLGIALDIQDPLIDERAGEVILELVTCYFKSSGYKDLTRLLEPVSRRLDAAAAAKATDTLLAAMSKTTNPALPSYNPALLSHLSKGFQAVSEHVDAATAAKAADMLQAIMSKEIDPYSLSSLLGAFKAVGGRLDSAAAAKAADTLLVAMNKAPGPYLLSSLSQGLQAVSGHLDAATAAKAADTLVAMMSKTTDVSQLSKLPDALWAVSGHLDAAEAAKAANTLVTAMSKTPWSHPLPFLLAGVKVVSRRLDAAEAAKMADTILVAMSKARGPYLIPSLSQGLHAVSGHLDAATAAVYAAKAADMLLAAMSKTTEPVCLALLSESLQAVSGHLDAATAAVYAAKAADTLLAAMSRTTNPVLLSPLIRGLQEVSGHLDAAAAAKATDKLLAAMSKTTDSHALSYLLEGLQAVSGCLDTAAADKLFAAVSKYVDISYDIKLPATVQAVTERCSTPELLTLLRRPLAAGPIQRILLDTLGHRTRRDFRNTWHFLDWARSNDVDLVPSRVPADSLARGSPHRLLAPACRSGRRLCSRSSVWTTTRQPRASHRAG
jgi:hypothetical protein